MVTEVKIVLTFMGTVGIDWKGHEGLGDLGGLMLSILSNLSTQFGKF